jgi:hypothetical protein
MEKKDDWQREEMCFLNDRLLSRVTPRLRAASVGLIVEPWNVMDEVKSFERC